MAWVTVPGSAGIWEYENTATGADTYSDANGTYAGGIRSFTPVGGRPCKKLMLGLVRLLMLLADCILKKSHSLPRQRLLLI